MQGSRHLRLRQICLVAPDIEKAEADIFAVLGSRPCYRDPNVAKYGLQNALFPIGVDLLEVVVPTRADTAAGRFLERSGGRGGYMVIMDCSDVDRRRKHVESLGIRIVNVLEYDGFKAIQLHPRDGRAAILEFNETVGGDVRIGPYHPAGPDWPMVAQRPTTSRLLSVEVESPSPKELAAHWANILEVSLSGSEQLRIQLEYSGISFRACENGHAEGVVSLNIAVQEPERAMRVANDRGLVAKDGSLWLYGVEISLASLSLTNKVGVTTDASHHN